MNLLGKPLSATILSVLIGLTFSFAAVGKVLQPDHSNTILGEVVIGGSHRILLLVAATEFFAGAALVAGIWRRLVSWACVAAIAIGLLLLVIDRVAGGGRPCGCIGEVEHGLFPVGFWWSTVRALSLITALLYLALSVPRRRAV